MTSNEQVLLQSILAKIDHVERVVLEQRLQQQRWALLGKDILTLMNVQPCWVYQPTSFTS